MPFSDYKCTKCGKIFEYYKVSFIESFPKVIECEYCGAEARRKIGKIVTDIAEGKTGNSKSNYNNNVVYHPGAIVGRMKGKRIK